jgi:hypothetical protein
MKLLLWPTLVVLLGGVALSQTSPVPIKVLSARRAEAVRSRLLVYTPDDPRPKEARPKRPNHVMLVLTLDGKTLPKDANDFSMEKIAVQSGGTTYTADMCFHSVTPSGESVLDKVVFIVPKDLLNFTFHVGDYPAVSFTARQTIVPLINLDPQ